MVCMRVALHENDGNHENDEDDSYKEGVECWIDGNHGNHRNDKNHGNPGCNHGVPQTTGLEIPYLAPEGDLESVESLRGATQDRDRHCNFNRGDAVH